MVKCLSYGSLEFDNNTVDPKKGIPTMAAHVEMGYRILGVEENTTHWRQYVTFRVLITCCQRLRRQGCLHETFDGTKMVSKQHSIKSKLPKTGKC